MSRYIDTDKVREMAIIHEDFKQSIADLTSLREVLDDTPTADVAEVIHGEWIRVDGDVGYSVYQCSKCGGKVVLDDEGGVYDYCPHCGAIMDGERKDKE